MDRVILHCDMNAFYASVELLSRPDLEGKPVAVCGDPNSRHGIILAKNEHAKKFGVITAETIWQARKKCPDLILIPPHHEKYKEYSKKINSIYLRYTDMVEPFSIDESWLDVTASTALFGSGKEIADRIRNQVRSELGLTLSAGVSYNKIFAKMGSEYKKPDATTEITKDNFRELLWPKPVEEMFFVGFATAQKLKRIGIKTIGDLACTDVNGLVGLLGKSGRMLFDYANGLDQSPVCMFNQREKIKSVGNGITFKRNLISDDDISTAVTALSDTVASRLRKYEMKARGVKVDIKDPSFKTISRQMQLDFSTNLATEIKRACLLLIQKSWQNNKPIRLLTVTAINLTDETEDEQLSFFAKSDAQRERDLSIETAMDDIRKKFGNNAISFGSLSGNDLGIDL